MDCKDLVSVEQEGLEVIPAIKLLQTSKKLAPANHLAVPHNKKETGEGVERGLFALNLILLRCIQIAKFSRSL